jgi:hypothetical protein
VETARGAVGARPGPAKPDQFESRSGVAAPNREHGPRHPIMMLRPRGARFGRRYLIACTHHPSGLRPSGLAEARLHLTHPAPQGAPTRPLGSRRWSLPPNAPCPTGCSHSPSGLAEVEPLWRRRKTGTQRSWVRSNPAQVRRRQLRSNPPHPIMMLSPRGARFGRTLSGAGVPLGTGHLGLPARDPHPLRYLIACAHHPSGLRLPPPPSRSPK